MTDFVKEHLELEFNYSGFHNILTHFLQLFSETGSFGRKTIKGQPSLCTAENIKDVRHVIAENPKKYIFQ